jgi:hypothetical protein
MHGPTNVKFSIYIVFTNTTWYMSMLISLWVMFQLQFNQRTKIKLESEGKFYCEVIVCFDNSNPS